MREFLEYVAGLIVVNFDVVFAAGGVAVGTVVIRDGEVSTYDGVVEISDLKGNQVIISEDCEVRRRETGWDFFVGETVISLNSLT